MTKTKFRPILFSTPMVQAILEGRKTMTRRTKGLECINESPDNFRFDHINDEDDAYKGCYFFEYIKTKYPPETYAFEEPVMNVGDILWVHESFYAEGNWEPFGKTKTGKQKYRFIDNTVWSRKMPDHGYKYLDNKPETILQFPSSQEGYYKRNSLFMPKAACRIFLKVKLITAEKLQDISEADIKKEGIFLDDYKSKLLLEKYGKENPSFHFLPDGQLANTYELHKLAWFDLWTSINGLESWLKNPFVWVYEFERIDKPLDFI